MDVAREKALRERVAELEEEVRQLRAQLEPQMDWRFLRLSLTHSRILSILYAASPYTATHERLETVSTRECVRNHLKTLRPRLAPLGVQIRAVWCEGYALLAADREKLDVARVAYEAGVPLDTGKAPRVVSEKTYLRVHDLLKAGCSTTQDIADELPTTIRKACAQLHELERMGLARRTDRRVVAEGKKPFVVWEAA
ncbi:MAG: hypothetical protein KF904_15235 [Rhodoblastus sp.]|nr:hypothetical protein [Rhodoblastus sp.]